MDNQKNKKVNLPVIDIKCLEDDYDEEGWIRVSRAIDQACQEHGFFYVSGHGMEDRFPQLIEAAKELFALPLEDKLEIDITKSMNHRGYGAMSSEQLDLDLPPDYKETYSMGLDLSPDHPDYGRGLNGRNYYPRQLGDRWKNFMERYYYDVLERALRILRAIAYALKIEKHFFDDIFKQSISAFRVLHYPPKLVNTSRAPGAGAHTDYGCITLLYQDEVGGLQVNSNGEWMDAIPIPGTFVVNIGDMMARWTNDRYKSTLHRVHSPEGINVHRYSSPFFAEPHIDTIIECLPSCQSPSNPAKYPPVKAGEYLESRFSDTYAYKHVKQ